MKKVLLMLLISASAFASSGFEAILNVPILISVGIPIGNSDEKRDVTIDLSSGITAQLGYAVYLENTIGVSILGEIGYAFNQFGNYLPNRPVTTYVASAFHSLQLGILPKFNIKNVSIGLGGGVKIPFSGRVLTSTEPSSSELNNYYRYMNFSEIKDRYDKMFVIPYIKLTMYGYYFFNDFVSLIVGLYITYSMDMNFNTDKLNSYLTTAYYHSYSYSSIGAGINIGISIGRKGSNEIKRIE